jgi:6-phosphogluconolactonase/glucosamine-6-phosphate isomerase/deaminase
MVSAKALSTRDNYENTQAVVGLGGGSSNLCFHAAIAREG